jgi:hypothetical protein
MQSYDSQSAEIVEQRDRGGAQAVLSVPSVPGGDLLNPAEPAGRVLVPSDSCCLAEFLDPIYFLGETERQALDLANGWTGRWTVRWKAGGSDKLLPVGELAAISAKGWRPVRSFSWRTNQRHRPGLAYMVSTGQLHGFESIAEQKLLLALDFLGDVADLVSQPMRIRFAASGGLVEHIPDFLVVTRGGTRLFDVRPGDRIKDEDRLKFAAAAEVALVCGWQYAVVVGWKRQVLTVLDDLSAQRRPLKDPLGIQDDLLKRAAHGPHMFRDLVAASSYPAIGRAHALHLLWYRRLGIDLSAPLGDQTLVWLPGQGQAR